jgi:hypothetical protein
MTNHKIGVEVHFPPALVPFANIYAQRASEVLAAYIKPCSDLRDTLGALCVLGRVITETMLVMAADGQSDTQAAHGNAEG